MPENFWLLLAANLPLLAALVYALNKKIIYMGVSVSQIIESFQKQLEDKDREVAFREQLRQEALLDRDALEKRNKEIISAVSELGVVVKQTLDLNEHLLDETLHQRWVENERRTPSNKTGTR